MDKIPKETKVITNKIKRVVSDFQKYNIDGYIVPKNDNFFSEYVKHDRLKIISNFSGSAGFAIIFKNRNYLFVDGRYTLQARRESGKNFKIIEYPCLLPKKLFQNITLGFDPKLFTKVQLQFFFGNRIKLIPIAKNLIDKLKKIKIKDNHPYYSLPSVVAGKTHKNKISLVTNILKKKQI